jgi:hypothetical protein
VLGVRPVSLAETSTGLSPAFLFCFFGRIRARWWGRRCLWALGLRGPRPGPGASDATDSPPFSSSLITMGATIRRPGQSSTPFAGLAQNRHIWQNCCVGFISFLGESAGVDGGGRDGLARGLHAPRQSVMGEQASGEVTQLYERPAQLCLLMSLSCSTGTITKSRASPLSLEISTSLWLP